jgi:hypothetical protein
MDQRGGGALLDQCLSGRIVTETQSQATLLRKDYPPAATVPHCPLAYRKRRSSRLCDRDPAYLLGPDRKSSVRRLLQIYFDRWQIEVNHREEKDTLGVGQAPLWNPIGVPKQPALVVAAYSALMLAALQTCVPQRGAAYAALPKRRRGAKRPSCLDLTTMLRKDVTEHPELLAPPGVHCNSASLDRGG